jgi:hypothetical protein
MTLGVHLPYRRMSHISKFHQIVRNWTVKYQPSFRLLAEQMRKAAEQFVDYRNGHVQSSDVDQVSAIRYF